MKADNPLPVFKKVLVVGDSISQHQPTSDLGWSGNWGMAATSEDTDYVHQFVKKLGDSQGSMPQLLVVAKGGGTVLGQAADTSQMVEFGADLAIVQLGENDNDISDAKFRAPYQKILSAIHYGNPQVKILCMAVWGPPSGSPDKDSIIRDLCRQAGGSFVPTDYIQGDSQNQAKTEGHFSNPGVQWHPGDRGMAKLADAIWTTLNAPPGSEITDTGAPTGPAQTILDEKWNGDSGVKWLPASPETEMKDNVHAAKFTVTTPDSANMASFTLIPSTITGHWITVHTRVKGEGLSTRPQPYNGAKICIHMRNGEGKDDYPQWGSLPDGTFDWRDVEWHLRVPDNVVSAEFGIGLEKVQGTIWVAPVTITSTQSANP